MPFTIKDDPKIVIEKVFTALKTQNLVSHVLYTHPLVRKDVPPKNQHIRLNQLLKSFVFLTSSRSLHKQFVITSLQKNKKNILLL